MWKMWAVHDWTSLRDDSSEKQAVEWCDEHLCSAEKFYSDLHLDTECRKTTHIRTISFHFQQNLPLPQLPVGDLFYMQQLWVYVFGIHSCGDNNAIMYCWPETLAKWGSNEVVSCLNDFVGKLPQNVISLHLYSDGCSGQTKNSTVMCYLFTVVALGRFQQIQHSFPVTGHSYLPIDRDFGRTELNKQKNEFTLMPSGWAL